MCGIIGYLGKKDALPILEKGLERLDYRGYDSAGVSVLDGGSFNTVKKPGRMDNLKEALKQTSMPGSLGLGHTRWATHGEVNEVNAHPHWDCRQEIALVHNGIIENYRPLKEMLIKQGHVFVSETDTEVIAHLIESYYEGDLEQAVLKALPQLQGSYALMVASKKEPDKIIAARMLSPLILGIAKDGYYLASDATALVDEAALVIYLEDGEVAVIRKQGFEIKDFKGLIKSKTTSALSWSGPAVDKKGFAHFMLKEIYEQPEVIKKNIEIYTEKDTVDFSIDQRFFQDIDRITIVACGTAYHAGLLAEYMIEEIAGIPVTVDTSSEFRYRNFVPEAKTLFVCISQSGETADTLAGLRLAKEFGFKTLAMVNVENSTIAREADKVIYTNAGPEIGVASTKAYLSQIIVLQLLALKLTHLYRKQLPGFYYRYFTELKKIPLYLEKILAEAPVIESLAEELQKASNFLYLGRGINYPNALEGALKLKEISYIHAEGYAGGEMKHGPIALIDKELPVIAISPAGRVRDKMLSNMLEVKARQGKIVGIITEGDSDLMQACYKTIPVPFAEEHLSTMLVPLPLQLLAYYIAAKKGCDVDKPRNLAKSVTVE
ncbi:MAG: glutamine--fructose-6-phosphate transaminase (isomerizing) [Candidatus Omnitrophica bacterium]|nr:glutamine--fructose-6-phosphate transaminase (isomerizing) [Candidatus Omnitrophota bacterium]